MVEYAGDIAKKIENYQRLVSSNGEQLTSDQRKELGGTKSGLARRVIEIYEQSSKNISTINSIFEDFKKQLGYHTNRPRVLQSIQQRITLIELIIELVKDGVSIDTLKEPFMPKDSAHDPFRYREPVSGK